jgi:hypothetical protein
LLRQEVEPAAIKLPSFRTSGDLGNSSPAHAVRLLQIGSTRRKAHQRGVLVCSQSDACCQEPQPQTAVSQLHASLGSTTGSQPLQFLASAPPPKGLATSATNGVHPARAARIDLR